MSTELEYISIEPDKNPTHLVVWLHGLGADGYDFESVAQMMRFGTNKYVKFILPHAPIRPITLNGGMSMRGWYDIKGLELTDREDEPGIISSSSAVFSLIDHVLASHALSHDKVFIVGFSQGGAIALHAGLTSLHKIAGIVALSTYLPLQKTIQTQLSGHKVPILQVHGTYDPIVKEAWGNSSNQYLKSLGYDAEYHRYPMEHQVCPEEIKLIEDWILARLI